MKLFSFSLAAMVVFASALCAQFYPYPQPVIYHYPPPPPSITAGPAIVLPPRRPSVEQQSLPTGVSWDKIGEGYSINGKPCSRRQAYQFIEDKTLSDDSNSLRVTVIDPDKAFREKVAAEIKALPNYQGKLLVQAYAPDARMLKGLGFVTEGHPVIIVQRPSGKELHRQAHYNGGITAFAGALRDADPTYNKDLTPDLTQVKPPSPPGPHSGGGSNGVLLFAIAAASVTYILSSKK